MEEGKRSCVPSYFALCLQPLFTLSSAPCALCSAAFANNNQWLLEEGGEQLASEINGMVLHFISSAHTVPNVFGHGIR